MDKVVDSVNNSSHAEENYDYGELNVPLNSYAALTRVLGCGI